MQLSRRVMDLKPSATIAVMNRAKDMQRQGIDVASFAAGEPDFDTPEPIKQTALRADLERLWTSQNRAANGSTRVESEYLEVVATRAPTG